jgi:ketosteroid isomerase-like protein
MKTEAIMMDNVLLVQSLYAAFGRGDVNAIVAGCDPNIAWYSNADPALLPFGGERKGADGVRSYFRDLAASFDFESFQTREFFGGPDFVAVIGRAMARSKATGCRADGDWMHLFKIRNGKVAEFRIFGDTHAIVQAHFGGDVHSVMVAPSEATARLQH